MAFYNPPVNLSSPPAIGDGTPNTGAYTVLAVSGPFTLNGAVLVGASNIFAIRNGINPQAILVYNTFTDSSNGEWGLFQWGGDGADLYIGTGKNGTGQSRPFVIQIGSAAVWKFSTLGHFLAAVTNTYDVGGTGAVIRDLYLGRNLISGTTTYYPHDVAGTLTWTTTP